MELRDNRPWVDLHVLITHNSKSFHLVLRKEENGSKRRAATYTIGVFGMTIHNSSLRELGTNAEDENSDSLCQIPVSKVESVTLNIGF